MTEPDMPPESSVAGPIDVLRSETVELAMADVGVGWAEIALTVGDTSVGPYTFSMVWDPCPGIRRFAEDLEANKATTMVLPGEPGAFEVSADPINEPGWIRLQVWDVDHRGVRALDFEALCPGANLAASMRRNIGFLAKEGAASADERSRRGFWRQLSDWLIDH
jgi:hypothetical protein